MKRSITVVYNQTRTRVVWYDGTSDAMVEKAACIQLGLPSTSSILLKDVHGELVPIAACLPPAEYVVVRFGAIPDDNHILHTANHVAHTASCPPSYTSSSTPLITSRGESDDPAAQPPSTSRTKRTGIPTVSTKLKKTSPTALMKLFLETFTVPLASDDIINFVPNHGEFGIDRLYATLVPAIYLPQDTTTFYKLASSSIVLDRQRVIRYYRVGDVYAQLLAVGKGPLLRAYVDPCTHNQALLSKFAAALDASTDWLAARYMEFLHGFTPISRTEFVTDSE
ncbi:hypothetical protein DYB37_005149 [Aphanomyces astaci]|uniref:Uncharacterized protein n=1 Tax=Aphanomyces astaci TaxID=112090 RepID=A0A3R6X7W5_APHAT|nr:hypothetical protein DYB35_009689 [Aphanomyces astaci]RHZ13376.1 hypothetical protein DYB37_005149 [Aphanomyces astaci]